MSDDMIEIVAPCVVGADGSWAMCGTSDPDGWIDTPENQALEDYFNATQHPNQRRRLVYVRVMVPRPRVEPPLTVDGRVLDPGE